MEKRIKSIKVNDVEVPKPEGTINFLAGTHDLKLDSLTFEIANQLARSLGPSGTKGRVEIVYNGLACDQRYLADGIFHNPAIPPSKGTYRLMVAFEETDRKL